VSAQRAHRTAVADPDDRLRIIAETIGRPLRMANEIGAKIAKRIYDVDLVIQQSSLPLAKT